MKKLVISCLMIVSFSIAAFSQKTDVTVPKYKIDSITKKITYTEVVDQLGSKDTLYNRAIHWCGIYFKNLSYVSTMSKADGKIAGNYTFKVFDKPGKDSIKVPVAQVNFTFSIDIKDNKYRYTVTNLKRLNSNPVFLIERWLDKTDKAYKPEWDYYFSQVDKYMRDFIKSLKTGLMEAKKKSDNW
jgi:hypothetical protein